MGRPGRILAATDFSPGADRALRRATLLARQFDAAVDLVHVLEERARSSDESADESLRLLEELAVTARNFDGISIHAHLREGSLADGIGSVAEQSPPDLIVVGASARPHLRTAWHGSPVERLQASVECPLLVAAGIPTGPYRRAMVAVDLSQASRDIVARVSDLGLASAAPLLAMHVFEIELPALRPAPGMTIREQADTLVESRRDAVQGELRRLLVGAGDVECRAVHRVGSVGRTLLDAVLESGADLVVTGGSGHAGLGGRLRGSVVAELLRGTRRDLLIVPLAEPRRFGAVSQLPGASGEPN